MIYLIVLKRKEMLGLKKQYKQPPSTFGNTRKIKSDLIQEQQERRKKRRTKDFEEKRKENSHFSTISQKSETDKIKLLKWKMERQEKKKEQELQKKPPFIVGRVHHNFYSPIKTTKNSGLITKKKIVQTQKKFNNQKGITRATREKKLLLDPAAVSLKTPLFGGVSSSNEFSTKDAIMEKLDIPMEEKEHTIEDFKRLLYKENDRLQKCCKHWTEVQSRNDITEDIQCHINQAVGQTTLLINKKFRQFYGLILLCEKDNTDVLITCTDLHGFWDMMYIEIKDCYSRFEKLEELCAGHWKKKQLSFISSAKKETNTKKYQYQDISIKRSSLQALISSDNKKRKMTKMQEGNNKKDLEQILFQPISNRINMNNEFTPLNDKGTVEIIEENCNVMHYKCRKNLLKIYTKPMHTSTPFDKSSNLSMNASLIIMKIGQLYNKSTMYDHTCISPVQTLRKNIMGKSGKSRESLRIKSACNAIISS